MYVILNPTFSRYRNVRQWMDGTADLAGPHVSQLFHCAGMLSQFHHRDTSFSTCDDIERHTVSAAICETPPVRRKPQVQAVNVSVVPSSVLSKQLHLVPCPAGHFTHAFLACQAGSQCLSRDSETCARTPTFSCASRAEHVPYTYVCDHKVDCSDGSDEDFCDFPPCKGKMFDCGNKQVRIATHQFSSVSSWFALTGACHMICHVMLHTTPNTPLVLGVVRNIGA
jgi:hypothetical protein